MTSHNIKKCILWAGIAAFLSPPCAPSFANDGLPNLPKGLPYRAARIHLLRVGYTPFVNIQEKQCSDTDERCRAYPEIISCANDAPVCLFEWKSKKGKIINITNEGEELKSLKIDLIWWPPAAEIPKAYR